MHAGEAVQSGALAGRDAQALRHRPVNPHDTMPSVQDGDQVWNTVERMLPFLFGAQ